MSKGTPPPDAPKSPKSEQHQKRLLARRLLVRVAEIHDAFRAGVPVGQVDPLTRELETLRVALRGLGFSDAIYRPEVSKPLLRGPKSYRDARLKIIEEARRVSRRDGVTASFVQGGSPGAGRKR